MIQARNSAKQNRQGIHDLFLGEINTSYSSSLELQLITETLPYLRRITNVYKPKTPSPVSPAQKQFLDNLCMYSHMNKAAGLEKELLEQSDIAVDNEPEIREVEEEHPQETVVPLVPANSVEVIEEIEEV